MQDEGRLVIVLKRHAEALHELSGAEVEELGRLVAAIFKMLKADEQESIAPEEIKNFCEALQAHFI